MRQHRLSAVALEGAAEPRAEHDRTGERDESADGMDHGRSGKIMETHAERREDVAGRAHVG